MGNKILDQNFINSLGKNFEYLSHAYLFVSPDSTYNNLCAEIFASHILCENKNFCGSCPSCQKSIAKTNLDLTTLPTGKTILAEDINLVVEKSLEKPMFGDFKVFILKEIDSATIQAQNKLLKTLEEPPRHVVFILTATNENKILPTIISRVRKIFLPRLNKKIVEEIILSPPPYLKEALPSKLNTNNLSEALEEGEGWLGKTIELLKAESFPKMYALGQEIALSFSKSKDLPVLSSKVLEFKDTILKFLEILGHSFEKLLREKGNLGYCEIITNINSAVEELGRNVGANLIVDNLLMKILEIKYNYNL